MASPIATEVVAGAGFDWFLLDMEHSANDLPQIVDQLRAAEGGTAEPIVRVPWNEPVVGQARARPRRTLAALPVRAVGRGGAPRRAGDALSAEGHPRRRRRDARDPLRPHSGLFRSRRDASSACWCKSRRARRSTPSRRSLPSRASTASSSGPPTCRPTTAIPTTGSGPRSGPRSSMPANASRRPASQRASFRGGRTTAARCWRQASASSRSAATPACLARNSEALVKLYKPEAVKDPPRLSGRRVRQRYNAREEMP